MDKLFFNNNSFLDDQEKMVDFFTISKEEFLNFYSYLTEEEYEATKEDVLNRSGYWNKEYIDREVDGRTLAKIFQGIMIAEWLQNR